MRSNMHIVPRGLLIIFSGPSGVGKGTLRNQFMHLPELNLAYSISQTSRSPRRGEVDGVDYYFVTTEQFEANIANNQYLEYAHFVGSYYGTLISEVERLRNQGKNVVLEVELDGACQVQAKCPDALSIFVLPPSLEELEKRIRSRGTENAEVIEARLQKARKEMETAYRYQYAVCNDDINLAADIISLIIKKHIERNYQAIEEQPDNALN